MDSNDLVYFVNSQGEQAVLSSPGNAQYWELRGRSGFTAPDVDVFSDKYASGVVRYRGKALKPRNCSMSMVCRGDSEAERDAVFFRMVDILTDANGTGEGKLYVRRSNGSIVHLNCVYSGGMNIVEKYKKLHLFTLKFYAADPWFYGPEKEYDLNPLYSESAEDRKITIDNVKTGAVCRFTVSSGYFQGGYVENSTTGKKFTIAGYSGHTVSIPSNNTLEINFGHDRPQVTLESASGSIKDGSKFLIWDETDADFGLTEGQNVIDFSNLDQWSSDFVRYGKMYTGYRYLSA